jgi:hypothetical protein
MLKDFTDYIHPPRRMKRWKSMFIRHWTLFPLSACIGKYCYWCLKEWNSHSCRFSNRFLWFLDAYQKGLNGKQAAWANRKYRGHHTLPDSILQELGDNQITLTRLHSTLHYLHTSISTYTTLHLIVHLISLHGRWRCPCRQCHTMSRLVGFVVALPYS